MLSVPVSQKPATSAMVYGQRLFVVISAPEARNGDAICWNGIKHRNERGRPRWGLEEVAILSIGDPGGVNRSVSSL